MHDMIYFIHYNNNCVS